MSRAVVSKLVRRFFFFFSHVRLLPSQENLLLNVLEKRRKEATHGSAELDVEHVSITIRGTSATIDATPEHVRHKYEYETQNTNTQENSRVAGHPVEQRRGRTR